MSSEFPLYAPSEEHREIRKVVRELAEARLAPFAAAVDEEARYPEEAAAARRAGAAASASPISPTAAACW